MNSSITVHDWLKNATARLNEVGIETARLDALILLESSLGQNRVNLLAHQDDLISNSKAKELEIKLSRREKNEPLAFIQNQAQFYGRSFYVNNDVLVPRPESEAIIEEYLSLDLTKNSKIADIGTGSGALGITAKLEEQDNSVYLYDLSDKALAVAIKNIDLHKANIETTRSNLLSNVRPEINVFLVNLPYVPNDYPVNKAVSFEPHLALYGGIDGMDVYRDFWSQIRDYPGAQYVISESLPSQHQTQTKLAKQSNFIELNKNDFVQVFKRSF